jgi:cyclophilin family peptidyl-prolyl cis-trans isomerase
MRVILFLLMLAAVVLSACNTSTGYAVADSAKVNDVNTYASPNKMAGLPAAVIETGLGKIEIELDERNSPVTVENFIAYADSGFYEGTIFHRVIKGFMVQGGGFTPDGFQKLTKSPIILESNNGLKNKRGTIAMARTVVPDSATSQFFINTVDNDFLDYAPGNPGYAVFGRVVSGMDVVERIEKAATSSKESFSDWPVDDVVILKVVVRK